MITIRTTKGKFFFSSFISLSEENEAQIDETLLSLFDLKYLVTAVETDRVQSSEEDLGILKATIITKESGSGSIDLSQYTTRDEVTEAIAQAKLGTGDGSTASWSLTNASMEGDVLTYTGGNISEGSYGLYAEKPLVLGETVTIDFEVKLNDITSLTFSADDGSAITDRYGDNAAVIFQDLTSAILISKKDWMSEYKAYLQDLTTYKASITRVGKSRVLLSVSDLSGIILMSRDVDIPGFDLKRVWLSVYFTSPQSVYTNTISIDKPVYALQRDVKEYEVKDSEFSTTTTNTTIDEFGKVTYTLTTKNVQEQLSIFAVDPVKVNTIPLYSLDNEGEYVLTEPDSWGVFEGSNYLFPLYHRSTLVDYYLKGIVKFTLLLFPNRFLRFYYEHNIKDVIDNYIVQVQSSVFRLDNSVFPRTFESSPDGSVISGSFDVPLETIVGGWDIQTHLNEMTNTGIVTPIFEFSFKSDVKETVIERQKGLIISW